MNMDSFEDSSADEVPLPQKIVKKSKQKEKPSGQFAAINSASVDPFAPKVKPQVAKKLRKEKRQQKLLKKLDNDAKKSKQDLSDGHHASKTDEPKRKKNKNKKNAKVNGDLHPEAEKAPSSDDNCCSGGRPYSVSIAVAGSIIDNAQSPLLMAYLAGQIARAAAIFKVDEVIVFDDAGGNSKKACELMARVLQFLECPQYLRKYVFPIHPDLQYAGVIAPLDIPHHLRRHEALPYREGIVSSKPTKEGKDVSYIYVGLDRDCRVEKKLPEGIRVTVKFDNPDSDYILKPKGKLKGKVISPHTPRTEAGIYWGYIVRIADSLSKVFTQCPYMDGDGYDLTLGTSEKGSPVSELKLPSRRHQSKPFKHILIVFGGVEGLEYALENDETLMEDDVSVLFDHYVNTCPSQGSRTIRTEEAILISMTAIEPIISSCYSSKS